MYFFKVMCLTAFHVYCCSLFFSKTFSKHPLPQNELFHITFGFGSRYKRDLLPMSLVLFFWFGFVGKSYCEFYIDVNLLEEFLSMDPLLAIIPPITFLGILPNQMHIITVFVGYCFVYTKLPLVKHYIFVM